MRIYVFEILEGKCNGKFIKEPLLVKKTKNVANEMLNVLRTRGHNIKMGDVDTLLNKKTIVITTKRSREDRSQMLSFYLKTGFITFNKLNEVAYTRSN